MKLKPAQQKAAMLVAQGASNGQVAAEVGVSLRTIVNWKRDAGFQAAVDGALRPWLDQMRAREIADREKRLERLNADRLRLMHIRDARAQDPAVQAIPGGKTGLVIRCGRRKLDLLGQVIEETEEYKVDYRMLERLESMEEQAARDLGQRDQKRVPITSLRDLSKEELQAIVAEGVRLYGAEAMRVKTDR
jgi:hypothetical protein